MDYHDWLWWLLAALSLGILQIYALDVAFGLLALAALGAGIAGLVGVPFWGTALVFAVLAVGLVIGLRAPMMRKFKSGEQVVTGAAALVGARAIAIDSVTTRSGRVKLNGEVWTARTREGEVAEDAYVTVIAIEGATAIVAPETE